EAHGDDRYKQGPPGSRIERALRSSSFVHEVWGGGDRDFCGRALERAVVGPSAERSKRPPGVRGAVSRHRIPVGSIRISWHSVSPCHAIELRQPAPVGSLEQPRSNVLDDAQAPATTSGVGGSDRKKL